VLPTYNRADLLPNSIESVLNQTYADLELVVVDDASSDRTEPVVRGFDDPRIRYVAHETNQGVSAARNTGIARSRGDIVAFQDSDDEWLPEKLRKQMDVFNNAPPDVGVVYTGMYRCVGGDERYLPYPGIEKKEGDIQDSIIRQNFISTQMAAVRRDCFNVVGDFDEKLAALVDWELWIRLSRHYRFRLVDEPLVKGGVESDSISKNRGAIVEARERIVEKHRERFDSDSLANHLFFIGHGAMKLGQTKKGRRYLRKALWTKPQFHYAIASAVSHLGKKPYNATYRAVKALRRA
jgi:glycosyltransferase involved in cell wall biosynthesis